MKLNKFIILASLALISCKDDSKMSQESTKEVSKIEIKTNEFWWPQKVNLSPLRQHSVESNPYGEDFDYAKEFEKLDLESVKEDIQEILTTSQDWWPADYGNYGPFFIRMAWHSAGTYRISDGRGGAGGGQQRFEPLNSWPDNANLDKARRLLWPIKKKYGRNISWADLMVLAGNVSLESMGFKTIGFAGGRSDDWEADLVYWGPETEFMARQRHDKDGKLHKPLGATQMGLIYVNPEGPNGDPDPLKAAQAIREAFGQMAMNDAETVALIAGGHTFGKAHGAHKPSECVGKEPAAAKIEEQGFGWKNKCGSGKGVDTVTSGLEGAWSASPVTWTTQYLDNLFGFEWKKVKSPGGATQWIPTEESAANMVPDAHDSSKTHAPIMFTTDLALKFDPEYKKIAKSFHEDSEKFEQAFASAWFKLTHRDMGPRARYVGKDTPKQAISWQDPVPARDYKLINEADIAQLKSKILDSGLTISQLVKTAWASASSFRNTDMRGGANGARIRLEPQIRWEVNDPQELSQNLTVLEEIQIDFNKTLSQGKKVSLSDVIILGGAAAIEKAAKQSGVDITVSFKAGRTDASQEQTNIQSFAVLEPKADAFRNYYSKDSYLSPVNSLIDRANLLNLSVPEMTALIGGLRVLGANSQNSKYGVLTKQVGVLNNNFFVNLLDMTNKWVKSESEEGVYKAIDRKTGEIKWKATSIDLVFGSSSELRAISEVYASDDANKKFIQDFAKAWVKVMRADRFDLN